MCDSWERNENMNKKLLIYTPAATSVAQSAMAFTIINKTGALGANGKHQRVKFIDRVKSPAYSPG